MGYYTNYNLSVEPDNEKMIETVRERIESARYALTESGDDRASCKWYGHEDDLKLISFENPNHLFTLWGEGEESGDLWVKYFKAGKMQMEKAKITYGEFDEEKLK